MTKVRLVGLKSEQVKVMDTLTRSHVFEPRPTAPIEGAGKVTDSSFIEQVLSKQARLAFAVDFLTAANAEAIKRIKKAKKEKTDAGLDYVPQSTSGRKLITYDDFYDCAAKEYELLAVCDRLETLSFTRTELHTEINKLESRKRLLAPYLPLPIKLSEAGKRRSHAVLIAAGAPTAELKEEELDFPVCAERFAGATSCCIAVVCHAEDEAATKARLTERGFSLCPITEDDTAKTLYLAADGEIAKLKDKLETLFKDVLSYGKYLVEIKTLYDFLGTDLEKYKAEQEFEKTESTYVLEGWIPKSYAAEVIDEIKSKTENIVVYLLEPEEGDDPPTLLDNPKVIKPFESITNMYSPPNYHEKDPNITMSIFFFIIFGMMMADAGYGLVLSLACTLLVRLTHFERGIKNLAAVFGICGISTVIWGALFGSWFGLTYIPPLWFNPLDQPIMLLAVCIILGVVHLMVGYGYQAYYLFRKKKPLDAICDVFFIYLLFVGIGLLALRLAFKLDKAVGDAGLYIVIASLVLIFCTAGRHRKGVLGKLAGGVSGLYGLVNLFSDVLSYARIFGIALAGGAIASAFNTILGVLAGKAFLIPIAVILGVALHIFNLAISLLGAYVHNARLQFLEFYGKFYTGEGRLFAPLGERTKYIRFA